MKLPSPELLRLSHRASVAMVAVALLGQADRLGASEPDGRAGAGDVVKGSSADSSLLREELQFALETAHRRIGELESELQAQPHPSNDKLVAALVAANREAEQYRIRYRDLLVRMESLGLATIRSDQALEDRMIKAVRERQYYLDQNQKALEQLMRLSEAVVDYLKVSTASSADVRLRLEAELRKTDDALGFGQVRPNVREDQRTLSDGRVVGYKADLKLAVIDMGTRHGVRVGMPLNIARKDRLVGTALVVDVRDGVAGALVQEFIREGDRVELQDRVEPRIMSGTDL